MNIQEILTTSTFKEDGTGTQANGLPIIILGNWVEVTVFDEELDDGREVLFELVKRN